VCFLASCHPLCSVFIDYQDGYRGFRVKKGCTDGSGLFPPVNVVVLAASRLTDLCFFRLLKRRGVLISLDRSINKAIVL